ncbi:hypothetical protein GUITHDRAFT_160742 [Guillardia theta CCMP2712]|uniref:Uncharacterized protein n=2 Tax=Guillardia theta TaxID=55529 RepID=L1JZB5_GUITC|nr:hypothetical protein GUITHDRAFT_160742 [Guillardia theta CCMP2712]EKX53921.1 hypothetical protein GUITHDRAFT_160742 [Guillardia theta CCMP2712]|eukprot:XP_005840901.1 hypothetical protein GUITHDRAFT_160742 [Guillardia theta CCMP2712]
MFRPLTFNETREESQDYKISLDDLPKNRWSHEMTALEPGCLLLATPNEFLYFQTYLHRSVIFLAKHDEGGSAGFVLDKPAMYEIGAVTDKLPGFDKCPLYLGGDVGSGIQVLHRVEELGYSHRIIDGVMMGFDPWHAKELLEQNKCKEDDFKFFYRYTRWVRGQLEEEVKAGKWFIAAGSSDLIFRKSSKEGAPLWKEVLELMGGRYSLICKAAYNEL